MWGQAQLPENAERPGPAPIGEGVAAQSVPCETHKSPRVTPGAFSLASGAGFYYRLMR